MIVQNGAKISILLLYLHIFPGGRFRFWNKAALIWQTCHFIAFFVAVTLQCVPVEMIWDYSVKGKCDNSTAIIFAGAGFSIGEDLFIMLMPIPCLARLNLSTKKRVALIAMFILGSFACVTSMMRLKYIFNYSVNSLDSTCTFPSSMHLSILTKQRDKRRRSNMVHPRNLHSLHLCLPNGHPTPPRQIPPRPLPRHSPSKHKLHVQPVLAPTAVSQI